MIVLRTKEVDFDVTYINLREKPDWFLKISPHGKVPVLNVDDDVLFESNAIAEFLEEVVAPHLHPKDPIKRARNRAWTDFVPDFSKALEKSGTKSVHARLRARLIGSFGCKCGATTSSKNSAMAFDSNSTSSSTFNTGTLPCGDIFRNQSGFSRRLM